MGLEKALLQIGHIYRSDLTCGVSLRNRIILVEAKDVTEASIRDRLADALDATWEQKDSGWFLTQTEAQRKVVGQRQYEYRLHSLDRLIQQRAEASETKGELNASRISDLQSRIKANEAASQNSSKIAPPGPSYGLPNQRFLTRILQRIGSTELAQLGPGHRMVFALHPNSIQRKINVDLSPEFARASQEQAAWLSARPVGSGGVTQIYIGSEFAGVGPRPPIQRTDPSYSSSLVSWPNQVSNVLLAVFCDPNGIYTITVKVIPKNSLAIFSASATTREIQMEESTSGVKFEETFQLSSKAQQFQDWLSPFEAKPPRTVPSQNLFDEFADPAGTDPLAYGLSESMCFLAHQMGKNLVACLDDDQIFVRNPATFEQWTQQPMDPETLRHVSIDDHWITVRKDLFADTNFPRPQLKNLIASTRRLNAFALEGQAAVAASHPRRETTGVWEYFTNRFILNTQPAEGNSDDGLKCIAYLSQNELSEALSARGIRFSKLNSMLQSHLVACVYDNLYSPLTVKESALRGLPIEFQNEPTLLVSNGISPTSTLFVETSKQILIRDEGTQTLKIGTTDPKSFGLMKYSLDHPKPNQRFGITWDANRKVSLVQQTTYTFRLDINDACYWTCSVKEATPLSNQTYTLDSLPDDIKREFDEGYRQGESGRLLPKITNIGSKQQNPPPEPVPL